MKKRIFILAFCLSCLFPFSVTFAADDCALTGKMVYMQLTAIRDIGPIIYGAGTKDPSVAVYVRDRDWNMLTDTERSDLQCYMPSLVKVVKDSPDDYLDIPSSAPFYKTAMKNIKQIPPHGWSIITGRLLENGEVGFDQVNVIGR